MTPFTGKDVASKDQRHSDFISLHVPLTASTRHLFGAEQFRKMKPTAYLINEARGGLIDEGALCTAFFGGQIAGAGLAVTDPGPPGKDNPLLKMENVIMSAHTAYCSEDSNIELRKRTAEAVVRALKGRWPRILANPQVRERTTAGSGSCYSSHYEPEIRRRKKYGTRFVEALGRTGPMVGQHAQLE